MADPKEIATGLTKAQKRLLLKLSQGPISSYHPFDMYLLTAKDLAVSVRDEFGNLRHFNLTPLGLAVKAVLEKEKE